MSTLDPEAGGPVSVFSAAVISVVAAGADVECLTLDPLDKDITRFPDYERMVARGVKVHAFQNVLRASGFLLRSVKTFDVVHVDGVFHPLCIAAVFIAKVTGRATVMSPHESLTGEELRRTPSGVRLALKRLLRSYYRAMIDCIVFSSALELRDSLGHSNAVVIQHPVFNDAKAAVPVEIREGFSVPGRIQLGYLGRFHFKKRLENIVTAAVRTVDVELVVAGSGPKEYEESLRALSRGEDRIKWPGFVQKSQREEFFRGIDVLVLASEYECFGMSAAEALVRGIPVIVSERVGIADDVRQIQAGFVVEGEVESLVDAFTQCSTLSLPQYRELQKNALAAARLYSFSVHARAQLGVYAATGRDQGSVRR
jgi:glycosyltransferase involved in cell wall biosynthesis